MTIPIPSRDNRDIRDNGDNRDIKDIKDVKVDRDMYDMAGVIQTISHNGYWIRYLWMALMVINGFSMRTKHPNEIRFMNSVAVENQPTDAGGAMHYYLENHPD